jgi:hypothetical protein
VLTADTATLFGIVGWIGCPSDVSMEAAKNAYAAQVNASVCALNNAETCPDAVNYAGLAYVGWSQLLASCDVADTASYTALATYGFCGGTW